MDLRTLASASARSAIAASCSRVGPNGLTVTLSGVSDFSFSGIVHFLSHCMAVEHGWQVAASESGTCARGSRICSAEHEMFTNSPSDPRVRLSLVNEHAGFAVASAHYIAFVELKHARPSGLL